MLLKLCGCLCGRGDDNNNNNSSKNKGQPAACILCCCFPCLCRHRASTHPQVFKDEGTWDDEMGTEASTPVISVSPRLNKYVTDCNCCHIQLSVSHSVRTALRMLQMKYIVMKQAFVSVFCVLHYHLEHSCHILTL